MAARSRRLGPLAGRRVHFGVPGRYNPHTLDLHCTRLFALAVLVAAFVALYPYAVECADAYVSGGCTHTSGVHGAPLGCSAATCAAAVLAMPQAVLVLTGLSRNFPASALRPAEAYLPLDTPPPRFPRGL